MQSHEGPPKPNEEGKLQERKRLIDLSRSVIPACDVSDLDSLEKIVKETCGVPGIGAYKVGLSLANPYGLIEVAKRVTAHTNLPIIYDHQKAGNDKPEMGPEFARGIRKSGVKAAILFPFSSPVTEEEWIKACQGEGLTVLVGGHMTHKKFLESEGGFIANLAPTRIYTIAAENGVRDFVVPGNKVEFVNAYRQLLERVLGLGNFTLYAPGFIKQGGDIAETGQVAGDNWHAIVGDAIYKAQDMKAVALQLTAQILKGK
ncbi:MAG: hypothetical protein HY424_00385 [Candidatus Levybacteria bacterium]|nr:hypothetical protein [Candidatus Levybacteria bacterium]